MTLFILEKKKSLPFVGLVKGYINKEHFLVNSLI